MFDKLKGLIPEAEYITLTDRTKRRLARKDKSIVYEFECDLFLPCKAGFVLMDQGKDILDLIKGQKNEPLNKMVINVLKKGSDEVLLLTHKIMEAVFKPQYSFMNVEWLDKNIDLKTTAHIVLQLLVPIVEYLQEQGYMAGEEMEAEKPKKNPTEDIAT